MCTARKEHLWEEKDSTNASVTSFCFRRCVLVSRALISTSPFIWAHSWITFFSPSCITSHMSMCWSMVCEEKWNVFHKICPTESSLLPCPSCLLQGKSKEDLASQKLEMAESLALWSPKGLWAKALLLLGLCYQSYLCIVVSLSHLNLS